VSLLRYGSQLLILAILLSGQAWGQFSPGPLASVHQTLEGLDHCTDCHNLGKGVSEAKCLDCHTPLLDRRSEGLGFHATVADTTCANCHSEHNGTDYSQIRWPKDDMAAFDHERTGYALTGAHEKTECRVCHTEKYVRDEKVRTSESVGLERTFLGLFQTCSACHEDVHVDRLPDTCETCHATDGWKPAAGFDHATKFVLDGAHEPLTCTQCHAKGDEMTVDLTFPEVSATCASCHETPHSPGIDDTCETCHNTQAWRGVPPTHFDHGQTRFDLRGKHEKAECVSCHLAELSKPLRPPMACGECHEDAHQGQFVVDGTPTSCDQCHNETDFRRALFGFDEHRETRFALEGAHSAIPCVMCHNRESRGAEGQFRWAEPELTCSTCHSSPHNGAYREEPGPNACETCHRDTAWSAVSFNHNDTPFPLSGLHVQTTCKQCHETGMMSVGGKAATACETCHEDTHVGQFKRSDGTQCETCHVTGGWKSLLFGHNRDSRFTIDGAHDQVACSGCHVEELRGGRSVIRYRPIDPDCGACHS
jgi:hypothetical protein